MRFLLDANLPRSAVEIITRLGHEAVNARDIGLRHAPDADIARRALSAGMTLISRDFDFADVRNYPPEQYHGIVILDLPDHAVASEVCDSIRSFVSDPQYLAAIPGRIAIVEPHRVRFRPPIQRGP